MKIYDIFILLALFTFAILLALSGLKNMGQFSLLLINPAIFGFPGDQPQDFYRLSAEKNKPVPVPVEFG